MTQEWVHIFWSLYRPFYSRKPKRKYARLSKRTNSPIPPPPLPCPSDGVPPPPSPSPPAPLSPSPSPSPTAAPSVPSSAAPAPLRAFVAELVRTQLEEWRRGSCSGDASRTRHPVAPQAAKFLHHKLKEIFEYTKERNKERCKWLLALQPDVPPQQHFDSPVTGQRFPNPDPKGIECWNFLTSAWNATSLELGSCLTIRSSSSSSSPPLGAATFSVLIAESYLEKHCTCQILFAVLGLNILFPSCLGR